MFEVVAEAIVRPDYNGWRGDILKVWTNIEQSCAEVVETLSCGVIQEGSHIASCLPYLLFE